MNLPYKKGDKVAVIRDCADGKNVIIKTEEISVMGKSITRFVGCALNVDTDELLGRSAGLGRRITGGTYLPHRIVDSEKMITACVKEVREKWAKFRVENSDDPDANWESPHSNKPIKIIDQR